ncbi:MAG: hypothetical protein Q7S58_13635, partial [Candidatus Binatus sp.]|nr:hypothetical protein [Candidatus Binatus sp.]
RASRAGVLGFEFTTPIVAQGKIVLGVVEGFALLHGRCFRVSEVGMTIAIRGKSDTRERGGEQA